MEKYQDIKQYLIDWPRKKTLMVVFPHPDDETMATGGILLVSRRLGWKTIVVTLTKGEAGRLNINPKGKTVSEIREEELRRAVKILRVSRLILGNFGDNTIKDKSNEVKKYLKKIIKKYKPGIIVTYDHSGMTGHPDHISLSIVLKDLTSRIREDKPTLFWATLPQSWHRFWHPQMIKHAAQPTHYFGLSTFIVNKYLAARSHRSQILTRPFLPLSLMLLFGRKEWYHKVDLNTDYPYEFIDFKI